MSGQAAAQPLLALRRPYFVDLVDRIEYPRSLWELQPRQLAPREDVNIGRHRLSIIERASADKQRVSGRDLVAAPQGRPAIIAKENVMVFAAAGREPERLRGYVARLDKRPLDTTL